VAVVAKEQTVARRFSAEALSAMEATRNDAAMLNAVQAATSAADAVCVALAVRRSSDPDHQRAADPLQEIGGRSRDINDNVRQLRALAAKKNLVELNPDGPVRGRPPKQ
jgi:hypothetical protein